MATEETRTYNDAFIEDSTRTWFFFMLLYLAVDYGRIQDVLPIGAIRPGMLTIILLAIMVITRGDLVFFLSIKQIRYLFYMILLMACYIPFARNNFYAWVATKTMLLYLPFILSVIHCVSTLKRLKLTVDALLVIALWIAVFAITHNGKGPGHYFGDENDLSLFLNMYIPFCYYLFFYEVEFKKKMFYLTVFVAAIGAIVISFSRGGFIGLLGVGGVIWLSSQKKLKNLAIICIIGFVIFIWAGDEYIQEMSTVTNLDESTASVRIESWKSAMKMFFHNPWGVGGFNFQVMFQTYQTDFFQRGMWGRVSHSLWFTLIPELGVLGIIFYFLILYRNFKDIFFLKRFNKYQDPDSQYFHALSLSFIASLAGFFSSGTFLSVLYYAHYWYMTGIIVAAKLIAEEYTTEQSGEEF